MTASEFACTSCQRLGRSPSGHCNGWGAMPLAVDARQKPKPFAACCPAALLPCCPAALLPCCQNSKLCPAGPTPQCTRRIARLKSTVSIELPRNASPPSHTLFASPTHRSTAPPVGGTRRGAPRTTRYGDPQGAAVEPMVRHCGGDSAQPHTARDRCVVGRCAGSERNARRARIERSLRIDPGRGDGLDLRPSSATQTDARSCRQHASDGDQHRVRR